MKKTKVKPELQVMAVLCHCQKHGYSAFNAFSANVISSLHNKAGIKKPITTVNHRHCCNNEKVIAVVWTAIGDDSQRPL